MVNQAHEPKPPLPPRPPSAAGRLSPQLDHAVGGKYSHQVPPSSLPPGQQFTTSWNDPYHPNPSPQASTFAVPPPPPPRPAEYEAQIQAQHNRINSPQPEYSHHAPSHHYDPPPQNTWNTQAVPSTGPAYYPTAPPLAQVLGTVDGPLVSPIEPNNAFWGHQSASQTTNNYRPPAKIEDRPSHPQALGFGAPSDWEHLDPSAPPSEQTPTSPPPAETLYQPQGHISPPQTHTTIPTSETPKPPSSQPLPPVEIGAPSPVTPRKDTFVHHPPNNIAAPAHRVDERPSSAGRSDNNMSVRSDSLNGTEKIDSAIQAWNTPLNVPRGRESTPRPESRTSTRVASLEPSPTVKVVDPYADLEPEFKASLKRYAAMLRKEAAAGTDEEKFDVFQTFVTKELRLRSLLYGVELKKDTKEVRKAASLADIEAALPKSAFPSVPSEVLQQVLPEDKAIEPVPTLQQQPPTTAQSPAPQPVIPTFNQKEPPILETSKPLHDVPPAPPPPTEQNPEKRPRSNDDSYVIVTAPGDEEAYSPGGRPIVKMIPPAALQDQGRSKSPVPALSPSNDAPMVIEDYLMPNPTSPSINAPILVVAEGPQVSPGRSSESNKPVVAIKFEPPRPAYTPFRYSTAVQEEKAKMLQPADRTYSSLRHSVSDSGRLMAQEGSLVPARPSSSSGRREHEEAFIGLIRKQSMAVRQKTPAPPNTIRPRDNMAKPEPPMVMRVGTPAIIKVVDPLKDAVTALRSLLPKEMSPLTLGHPKLKAVKSKIDAVPDQFGFIHETVVEWDRTNKEVRKEQEAERHTRQEESEAHIDGLFNDNEIGYADIGALEAEFKLAEAERRYRENQEELESFTAQVFAPVTERLQKEIAELMTAYTMAIDLLDLESEPVSRCFKDDNERAKMSEVMNCVLALFNKIEIRHLKVAEAHVERERRRKHLELTVLYTNGDTAGVKNLEKEFAVAEKMQVLHEARGKDNRANKLMDTFDRATVRGLGDNQMFIDDVLAKLRDLQKSIESGEASTDKLYDREGPRDTLTSVQEMVDAVMADSRKLLGLSNEADILLNDADYGVSVAEARVANADNATYGNLEKEKAKEDAKLIEETNGRIRSVTKGPQDAIALIREVIDRIGDDPEHQDRIKKALEAAKQRNASIDVGRE